MQLGTAEHYELMAQFERCFNLHLPTARKESKELWPKGYVYCHGPTNDAFLAFRHGYAYGRAVSRDA